jgi:hypothetical protein
VLRRHPLEFGNRYRQVGFRLGHRAANAGDQLKRRLHQLVADARVLPGIAGRRQLIEQLAGFLAQQLGLAVDQLDLPFDAERRAAGRVPLDSHAQASVPRAPGPKLFSYQSSPG